MTREESVIHGIMEAVERDSISRFLVKAFLLRDSSALIRINVESCPPETRELVRCIEVEATSKVSIYQIENRYGIPTFCSWLNKKVFSVYCQGFGSSLDANHALKRSLNELAQYYLIATFSDVAGPLKESEVLGNLSSYPLLHRCAEFNLGGLDAEVGSVEIDLRPSRHEPLHGLQEYIAEANVRIARAGAVAFTPTLFQDPASGMTVTHNFITGQEHFFGILNGMPVVPSTLLGNVVHQL